ncbi:MAG: hypothetical protein K2G89_11500 [Lachnospiraceae bacterium]|nr:hypothetical protein [Lachnospiraceae bacterium]
MKEENRQPEVTIEGNTPAGKKKKKLVFAVEIIFGIAVCAILGVMGAKIAEEMKVESNKAKYADASYVQQDILNYLKERYQEDFTLVENTYRGRSYAYSYVEVHAYPTAHQDEQHEFEVQGRYNEEGEMEYCDGYVMAKLTEEYEAYVDDIIGQYFDEYKFYMEFYSEWLTNNLPPDTRVEDLKNYSANVDYPLPELILYLPPQVIDEALLKKMIEMLSANYYRGGVGIKVYKSLELYDTKKRNDWNGDPYEAVMVYSAIIYQDGSIEYFMD